MLGPAVMSGSFPVRGKEAPKVLLWVHTLVANIKGNIRGVHHCVSPEAPAPLPGGILLPFQPALLGTGNVQPDAPCLRLYLGYYILGAKAIGVYKILTS
jgi:hypothetical protein